MEKENQAFRQPKASYINKRTLINVIDVIPIMFKVRGLKVWTWFGDIKNLVMKVLLRETVTG